MSNMIKIAYLCDRKKKCSNYDSCHNTCFHTCDTLHTKNGIIHDVMELYTDRFEKVFEFDEVAYYMEVTK